MRTWLIDPKPLQLYPSYRRLWIGSTFSAIGNHLTLFAVTIQIYTLTNNSLAVGSIGLFTGIPSIMIALCGGVLGDRYDRRKIILNTTFLQLIGCAVLWIYALLSGSNIFVLYCIVGWIFLLGSINVPVGAAILPRLIDKKYLQSAIVLRIFTMHITMFLGPLLGGILLINFSVATLYFIDMCTFCITLYGIFRLPSIGHTSIQEKRSWSAVKQGIKFVKNSPIIRMAIYIDFVIVFFCIPNALLPAINDISFGGCSDQLGLMVAALPLGGFVAMLFSGSLKKFTLPSVMMIITSSLYAFSAICFSLSSSLTLSLILLVIMGAFDSCVAVLRSSIIQKVTPDNYRARVSSIEYVFDNSATQLGNVRAGLLAVAFTPKIAILLGSLFTLILFLITFLLFPFFIRSQQNLS